MHCNHRYYSLLIAVFVIFWPMSFLSARSPEVLFDFTFNYKIIESTEERNWPLTLIPAVSVFESRDRINQIAFSDIQFRSILNDYLSQTSYLEQSSFKARVAELGAGLNINYNKLNISLNGSFMQSHTGEYYRNVSMNSENTKVRTSEFDPASFSWRDTAFTYMGGFNKGTWDDERYSEHGKLHLQGYNINSEINYDLFALKDSSVYTGTGLYYTAVHSEISSFYSYNQFKNRSLIKEYFFLYNGKGLITRKYQTRQIPVKVGFQSDWDRISADVSVYLLAGDGFFETNSRAPGWPMFQKSESYVTGNGWGYDLKFDTSLSENMTVGVNVFGKRFFGKGKDFMHGAFGYMLRAAQEYYNLIDYQKTPLIYQGIREQGAGISLEYHF